MAQTKIKPNPGFARNVFQKNLSPGRILHRSRSVVGFKVRLASFRTVRPRPNQAAGGRAGRRWGLYRDLILEISRLAGNALRRVPVRLAGESHRDPLCMGLPGQLAALTQSF